VITVPPASQTVLVGGTATFTVQATGTPPLNYQWETNGANLANATNSALALTNVNTNQGGFYTVTVSNANGSVTSSPAGLTVLPSSIVQNGGFETGAFTDWTLTGNTNETAVVEDSPYTYAGIYGVQSGSVGSPVYISQSLATVPGQAYLISCWVNNPEGSTPNEFLLTWQGTNLVHLTNITATNWSNIEATAVATGAGTLLTFGMQDNTGFLGLDDIVVAPVAQPSFRKIEPAAGVIVFQWSTYAGLAYQLQYATRLASNSWIDLGGPIIASNTVLTATDSLTNAQRFYRLLLLP
jgi:hypothetical protein